MMVYKFTSTIILLSLTAYHVFSQPASKSIIDCYYKHYSGTGLNDTSYYVYVERDSNAICYDRLSDTSSVPQIVKEHSEKHAFFIKPLSDIAGNFPVHWCKVPMLYWGEPFIYVPCDWDDNFIMSIMANAIVYSSGSNPDVDTNISVISLSDGVLRMQYNGQLYLQDKPLGLNIYIVDTISNIAVFEEVYANRKNKFQLMVDVRHIRSIPAIVCRLLKGETTEYRCDLNGYYIDFYETLKQNKLVICKE